MCKEKTCSLPAETEGEEQQAPRAHSHIHVGPGGAAGAGRVETSREETWRANPFT